MRSAQIFKLSIKKKLVRVLEIILSSTCSLFLISFQFSLHFPENLKMFNNICSPRAPKWSNVYHKQRLYINYAIVDSEFFTNTNVLTTCCSCVCTFVTQLINKNSSKKIKKEPGYRHISIKWNHTSGVKKP